jgi:ElaB/YqjD/DUF883 family membrane-anchored ribosome-binding protein
MAKRAAKKSAAADEIAAIKDLMRDLEKRVGRLSGSARREVSSTAGDVGDLVNEALARVVGRIGNGASGIGETLADEAAQFGKGALKKLANEAEDHPLVLLAVATGIGFLAGLANRR